jgi:hypothetical protein
MTDFSRRDMLAAGLAVPLVAASASSGQAAARRPGATLLTVSGNIARFNRGPLDPNLDRMMAKNGIAFDRAYVFDRPALQELGMRRIRTATPTGVGPLTFEGPLLRDLLAKVGAKGSTLTVTAADGYQPDIPVYDLNRWPVIFATSVDGAPLAWGGTGPGWVIYPRDEEPALKDEDESKWAWSVVHIKVG